MDLTLKSRGIAGCQAVFWRQMLTVYIPQVTEMSFGVFRCCCCSMWDLVSRPTIKPRPPALGPQSLGHWTIQEVPMHLFYWCIGYISRSRICGSNVYTVRILGTQYTEVASRKELTYQQLGNKLLSLLFCPSDKQNCSFVLHFVDY